MEGQGVAASAASAADGRSESGPGAGVAAELDHPAENHVTGDIATVVRVRSVMRMTVT
jgi:hypothetical protein